MTVSENEDKEEIVEKKEEDLVVEETVMKVVSGVEESTQPLPQAPVEEPPKESTQPLAQAPVEEPPAQNTSECE